MARHRRLGASSGKGALRTVCTSLLVLLAAAALVAGWFILEMEKPTVELARTPSALGGKVDLDIKAQDQKSGLGLVRVILRQNGKEVELFSKRFPRQGWFRNAGPKSFNDRITVQVREAGFQDGPAELELSARDQSLMGFLQGNLGTAVYPVAIDTRPPVVNILTPRRYIQPGGSAVVAYTVSETPARHGVQIGGAFFPGSPGPKPGMYVAYFALPWNATETGPTAVLAWDGAGNEARAGFTTTLRPRKAVHDTISLSDSFFQAKLPEFRQNYPEMQGDPLQQYLYINGEVRRKNAARVAEICSTSEPEQLWKDRFIRMPGAGRAKFADQRSYMYQGRKVDEQTHLGVDIASVAQAEIRAANRGKVVFAEYLGIFGNTVILDHGQGLFSLYAHLSSIEVGVGTLVEQNQPIARSGTSGMAGGDHLHYSMLIRGVFVTPVEWWDQNWINNNIKAGLHE